jgi:hypothetical protein
VICSGSSKRSLRDARLWRAAATTKTKTAVRRYDRMPSRVFQPGRNVWRIARARRTAVLVDGAAFFGAIAWSPQALAHRFRKRPA